MQGQQQDDMQQDGPRVGDSPLPGHWAAGIPGFAGAGYLAHGFDCLAGEAGLADGFSLLLKAAGITAGQAQAAGPQQLRDWYYACYQDYSGERPAGAGDVVAFDCGVHSANSGWP